MAAPPGIDPNDSRKGIVFGVTAFTLSVAFAALSLRIYTRAVLIKQFGMDDYAAVVAFLLVFACGFCVAFNTTYGFGTHVYFLDDETIKLYMRTFYTSIVFYNASLMAIKITFLLQYWRVLAVQRYRKVFITAMVVVFGWSTSQVLVEIFICTPISAFWDKSAGGTCIPNYPQWYINAGGNILTDVIVFVLPLPVISNLNLARGQKIVLLGIFCLGFFTVSISIIRIRFLKLTEDFTWENVESAGWSIGELCSGITCSCLPTFRPLLARWLPSLSARLSKKSSKYQRHDHSGNSGGIRSNDMELERPRRKVHSSDSRDDLYGAARYEISHPRIDRTTKGSQNGSDIRSLGYSPPNSDGKISEDTINGLRPDQKAIVRTTIAADQRRHHQERQHQRNPIEVRCDIVQQIRSSRAAGDADGDGFQ